MKIDKNQKEYTEMLREMRDRLKMKAAPRSLAVKFLDAYQQFHE